MPIPRIHCPLVCALVFIATLGSASPAASQHFSDCFATTTNATLLVPEDVSAQLGSSGDGLSNGDEIALFTSDGQCAGVGTWQDANLAIAVAGANSQESSGYEDGQSLQFRIWDASAQTVYEPNVTYGSCESANPLCQSDGTYAEDAFFALASLTAGDSPPDDPLSETVAVTAITASTEQDPNVAGNTRDSDLATRWSANGSGVYVQYELDSEVTLDQLGIAWYRGDQRQTHFRIDVSTGGSDWTTVHDGSSNGSTLQLEPYSFAATPARYVRIIGFGNTENTWTSITEVDIRAADNETPPPPETVTVAAVTASTEQDPNVAENTRDSDLATRWSANGSGVYVQYELDSEVTLDQLGIAWYRGDQRQTHFRIDVSTGGSDWTTVHDGSSNGSTLQLEPYSFAATPARYVRIIGFGNTENTWTSITEVDIRAADNETPPPPETVTVAAVTASTEQDPNVAENTRDSDLATRWSANGSGVYVQYELDSEVTLDQLGIAWYRGDQRQTHFRIDVSTGGSDWTTVHDGSSNGSTMGPEYYAFEALPARYVRITGLGNTENTWTSVTEVTFEAPTSDPMSSALMLAIDQPPEEVVDKLTLEPNYPNPFEQSTTLEYAIPEQARVMLEVYDVLGRRVARLVDQELPPGRHRVRVDAGSLTSGTYFYRLQVGDETRTGRMTVVR